MDKKEICEYCGKECTNKRSLGAHKKNQHRELQLIEFEKRKEIIEKERKEDVICMICGEKLDSVNQHVFYKHGVKLKDYKLLYPNAKLQKDKRKKEILNCPYCNKVYSFNNCLALHIKKEHEEHYIKKSSENKDGIKCEICNKKFVGFSQHVELSHDMSFNEYIEKFNYAGPKCFVTKEHRDNLSKNKIIFYNETERGLELKKEQSEKISGKNNPACRDEVRAKISRSAINRIDNYKYASRGIHVYFTYNGINFRTRSFLEFKVIAMLLENNIIFEYEKERIYYIDSNGKSRYYYPDIKIGDVYYEIKSKDNEFISDEKYRIVFELLKNSGKTIKMLSGESIAKDLGLVLHKEDYYCEFAKRLLDEDKIRFVWYSVCHAKSRILEKISKNYLINEKNFKVVLADKEHGNRRKNND
jgi:hypothetical protein